MKYLMLILFFITMLVVLTYILQTIYNKRLIVEERLSKLCDMDQNEKKYKESFIKNYIKSLSEKINKFIYNLMPTNIKEKLHMKLERAGLIQKINVYKWITIKLVISIILPIIYMVILYQKGGMSSKSLLSWLLISGILYALPNLFLEKTIQKRKQIIERELPDVLDLLTVSVEAGLSFDNSILKLTEKMKGVVMDEFLKVISEMRVGRTRKEALEDMEKRLGVEDVTTFIGALIQAYELGISISNVIKIQSKGMRQKRRQRAQEIAMKAPVKMLFPLVFFIFPSIFIILLGPAIIRIIETFR